MLNSHLTLKPMSWEAVQNTTSSEAVLVVVVRKYGGVEIISQSDSRVGGGLMMKGDGGVGANSSVSNAYVSLAEGHGQ
ncbi:hypothetical protein Tco_0967862 [Tanacetum coccineum]